MMRFFIKQSLQEASTSNARTFVALPKVSFCEDVAALKVSTKDTATSSLKDIQSKKEATADLLKLLSTYKEIGDSNKEPFLQFHNPRSFEDMGKEVPNFRALSLKAGEVPKFFDTILSGRAEDAVQAKNKWWAERKAAAESAAANKSFKAPAIPVPEWKYGKSVSLDNLKAVTDAQIKSLEPKKKVKDVAGNDMFMSRAAASKILAARRAAVHERYVKFWAKKVLVAPEQAVVPLKEVDSQLASKFEGVSPAYSELLSAVASGPKTYGERVASNPDYSSFLLKRESPAESAADYPSSEADKEGALLATTLSDPQVALAKVLGPELSGPIGSGSVLMSEHVKALAEHKYASDRYMYKELVKLSARYAEEEAALAEELKGAYGASVDVKSFQASPRTPEQVVADKKKEVEALAGEFAAQRASADSPYSQYAVTKIQQFLSDPSNVALEEVIYPELVGETLAIELAELAEAEAAVDEAEEEELWQLTMTAQLKHLQAHFGVDLPHGVLAHMDPILVKKIDYETTHGLDDWDSVLEDTGSEYAKQQWGLEALSHHFLPLIRYRRQKALAANKKYEPEAVSVIARS